MFTVVGFHHYTTRIQGSDSHDHRSGHIHDEFGPCVHISMVRSDIEKAEVYVATSHEPHFPSIPSDTNYDFTCEVEYPYNYTLLSIEVSFCFYLVFHRKGYQNPIIPVFQV